MTHTKKHPKTQSAAEIIRRALSFFDPAMEGGVKKSTAVAVDFNIEEFLEVTTKSPLDAESAVRSSQGHQAVAKMFLHQAFAC